MTFSAIYNFVFRKIIKLAEKISAAAAAPRAAYAFDNFINLN